VIEAIERYQDTVALGPGVPAFVRGCARVPGYSCVRAGARLSVPVGVRVGVLVLALAAGTVLAWIPRTTAGEPPLSGPAANRGHPAAGARNEDLLRLADEVAREVEGLRGWAFRHPVEKGVYTEAQLRGFIEERFAEDYSGEELAANEAFLHVIGAIPDSVSLRETITEVLMSQVGGFYNPANKTFYMIEREGTKYPPIVDRVLVAHELTHALDDQYVSLDSLMKARERTQDGEFVTGALMEGSATEIMTRYLTRAQASGRIQAADLQGLMESEMDRGRVFLEAPPYFQTLLANYTCGMNFLLEGNLSALLGSDAGVHGGKNFLRAVADPPRSSEQILHPEKYWDRETRDEPIVVDDEGVESILTGQGYRVEHRNTAGEILLAVVTTPADRVLNPLASALPAYWTNGASMGWGGDRFYLLERIDAPSMGGPGKGESAKGDAVPPSSAGGGTPTGPTAGLWITLWDSPGDRDEFAAAYTGTRAGRDAIAMPLGSQGLAFLFGLSREAAGELAKALTPERLRSRRGSEAWSPGEREPGTR
jgi:hypothetical protein